MIALDKNRLLNILLADDGSINIRPAVQLLADLPHDHDCSITALRVFTPIEGSEFSRVEFEAEKTKNLLKSRHLHFQSRLIQGYPSDMIAKYAEENHPDLIVIGSKATGILGGLMGNVATNIVHAGRWPVLIVRGPYNGLRRVLLVTDGSPASQYTCKYLSTFPLPMEADLEIMHVVIPVRATYPVEPAGLALPILTPEDEASLNQENLLRGQTFLEKAQSELGKPANTKLVLRIGDPLEQILNYLKSENIDLLVCGSRGAGNLTGWLLGSISRELVRQAPCSVLVVRTQPETG
ncbi:MAG: universal stress protein [Chloroflexi bacterium]|nr:universal stress protein [Chloroflexota bacterium]